MKPGIYRGMSFDEYKWISAWSPSLVKSGQISMLQLNYNRTHSKPATPAMRFGSAVHCAVLEPDEFVKRYCIWNDVRRGKAYTSFKSEAESIGQEILTESEYDTCLAARDSARAHPVAGPLLTAGDPEDAEVSLVWECNQTGLLCKGRADLILPPLVDLKTTRIKVADVRGLTRIASNFGYHIALAAYQDGISTLTGETVSAKLIFVEQQPPHDVRVMNVPDAVMAQGWDEWQHLLAQIAECKRTGIWPGCDSGESDLHVWDNGIEYETVTLDGIVI